MKGTLTVVSFLLCKMFLIYQFKNTIISIVASIYRDVAQVVARHVRDVDAASSNLVISTTNVNPDSISLSGYLYQ